MYRELLNKNSKIIFKEEFNNFINFFEKVIDEELYQECVDSFNDCENGDEYKQNNCQKNIAKNLLDALLHIKLGLVANPNIIKCFMDPTTALPCEKENVKFYSQNIKSDKTQALAVSMACGMKDILLIQGPPGAGKTTTILEIIAQLKNKKKNTKILITSGTHVAVDNVMERIVRSKYQKDVYSELKLYDDIIRVRQTENEIEEDSKINMAHYSEEALFNKMLDSSRPYVKKIVNNYINIEKEENDYDNLILSKYRSDIILKKGIIGVTINALNSCRFREGVTFDYVIIDEVGKSNFAEIMFAARYAKKLILIGDPKQLPSDVQYDFSNEETTNLYYKKLNEIPFINYLFDKINKGCFLFLNKQYRMVRDIGSYISDTFYNGPVKLENGRQDYYGNGLNYIDYDANKCKVVKRPLSNKMEVEIVKQLLSSNLKNFSKDKISVITPYKDQMRLLRKELANNILKKNINTVDAFQGQENEIVIFCCTRNIGKPTTFFQKDNRINVAISRAKNQIWLIGASDYIKNVKCLKKYMNFKSSLDGKMKCNKYIYDNSKIVKVN